MTDNIFKVGSVLVYEDVRGPQFSVMVISSPTVKNGDFQAVVLTSFSGSREHEVGTVSGSWSSTCGCWKPISSQSFTKGLLKRYNKRYRPE